MKETKDSIDFLLSDSFSPLLKNKARYLVLYGGRGSGKSEFIARKIIIRCLFEGGHRILIMRKVRARCKESIVAVVITILRQNSIPFRHNKTYHEITFPSFTGKPSVICYDGLDDPEKIKSIKGITGVWLEETTEFTRPDFEIINLSLREQLGHYQQIIMSFNPDQARAPWLKKMFFIGVPPGATMPGPRHDSYVHHSTIFDNPVDEMRKHYLGILNEVTDAAQIKIFKLGLWAVARGIIYQHPEIIPLSKYPTTFDDEIYGLDFGFNHPMALIWLGIRDEGIYLKQIIHESGLTTSDLIAKMKEKNVSKKAYIYPDPEAPEKCEELRRAGYNIKKVEKPPGSVHAGIMFVKSLKLFTCESNEKLNDEFLVYKWKEDKEGEPMDEPSKFDDDGLDGLRYAAYMHLAKHERAAFLIGSVDLY